jgi:cardiolipin synthase
VPGNEGRLLVDGPATHRAMFEAIGRAPDHVKLETYILEADGPGERLAELLVRKRIARPRAGVGYGCVGAGQGAAWARR